MLRCKLNSQTCARPENVKDRPFQNLLSIDYRKSKSFAEQYYPKRSFDLSFPTCRKTKILLGVSRKHP